MKYDPTSVFSDVWEPYSQPIVDGLKLLAFCNTTLRDSYTGPRTYSADMPTLRPTAVPSFHPTRLPTGQPSSTPSGGPSGIYLQFNFYQS